jgi:CHASE2 domain-containing sensor protein
MGIGRHAGLTALVCAGLAAAFAYAAEPPVWLEGLLFDAAVAASASARDDAAPAVALVAIDARSLDSPELAKYPRAMFSPIWAQTIAGLQKAGAKAISFDLVLAFSGNRIKPRFDNNLMRALAGANDLVVLGRSSRMPPLKKY